MTLFRYIIPECNSLEQYQAYIETLPLTDTPEVFGLHANADVSYQSKVKIKKVDHALIQFLKFVSKNSLHNILDRFSTLAGYLSAQFYSVGSPRSSGNYTERAA